MDVADRETGGHGHGHRIETSLLPLKKRASNYYSSGGGRSSTGGDPYASSSSKKKRKVDDDSIVVGAETKDTTRALEAPVPRQRRTVPAAASREPAAVPAPQPPAAASPAAEAAAAEGNATSSDEEKWLSKGKWLAKDESSSRSLLVTPQPPVKKLMHDGIRSFVPQPQHASSGDEHRRHAAAGTADLGEALERRLAELGATRPWLVHKKTLHKSDVDENQNRLLVSCKRGGGRSGTGDCPITRCFSPAEKARVDNKLAGLWLTAFDRGGAPYSLTCKFLESNNGYRFITEWKDFLTRNGMNLDSQRHRAWTRDVEVELWAFRSRKLPFQPRLDAGANGKPVTFTETGEDGKRVTVVQRISHHLDDDGALGLLLLHHENRRRVAKSEVEEGDDDDDDWNGPSSPPLVARKKGKQQSGKRRASAPASASPVALPAPVAVTERGGAATRSEPTYYAAIGLARLRQSIWERWQECADRRHDAKSSADVEGDKIEKQKKPGNAQHKRTWGK